MADYSSTLEAIRQQAQERLAQGISEEDLRAYGRNIGLTESEIDYVLSESQPKYQPQVFSGTSMSDLNKAIAADAYITKLATDLGDTNVSAGEQLALSDPEVRQLAENAFQRKNVDNISNTDLASYGKKLGLNQDLIDYLLGKEMNLDTSGAYDIKGNVLAALQKASNPTVVGGAGNDTAKETAYHEGALGHDFKGENTGLREPYIPFVGQMLGRTSALLARRNAPGYEDMQFGKNYGQDTFKTLNDLQTRREAMMAEAEPYTPYKYSFAPKPAAAGGVMSLVDKYQAGGGVSSGTTTGTQGGQAVSSTFTKPDDFSSSTFTSGYTTPTDMYTAGTISSGYTAPTDMYTAGTISSGYKDPTNLYTGPGASGITTGTATFDNAARDRLMNTFTSGVVDPAVREAKRQSQIQALANAARFTQAGAFGGTSNILAEAERRRNLNTQIGDIYGRGQKEAYDAAQKAFEAEQGRALTAGVESERARQEAGRQGLSSAQTAAQLGLQAQTAQEQARQVQGQQALSSAQTAAQLGLQAQNAQEQSRQFAAQYGLNVATTAADYEQKARQLQQQAEEAQARGDQFAADLALRQLQEANNAAAATRAFEYQQSRDQYLDPFREATFMSQILSGLPMNAAATGISPNLEALVAAIGTSSLLNPGTKASDRRLKTNIKPLGAFHDGLTVYSYRYKSGGPVQIGVMADEVAVLRPQAYIKGGAGDGFDAVDYSKL